MRVNMNHAATCASNPPELIEAVSAYLNEGSHTSHGRGGDEVSALRTALGARIALADFFGAPSPNHIIFNSGATEGLNMAINGLVTEGCHVLATSLEHNSVSRVLHDLETRGLIEVSWLACDSHGNFDPALIEAELRPNSRLLVMMHASNLLGNVLPVEESFKIARNHGLYTLLDAAQTAGHCEVKLGDYCDVIAFTGHKGLRGLGGSGGLVLSERAAEEMRPWKLGGTGSRSQSLEMPEFLPDRFEPGTPNTIGIIGLKAAIDAINAVGLDAIHARERVLIRRFVDGLKDMPVTLYGDIDVSNWMPVISLNIGSLDSGIVAARLSEQFGIETRSGLHCTPLAHKTIGTYPQGTLRFSFGADTSEEEIDYTLDAIRQIADA